MKILHPALLHLTLVPILAGLLAAPARTQGCPSSSSYDFNTLTGSDVQPFWPLHGQDGWTAVSKNTAVALGVTATTGPDGTQAIRFQEVGPGVGAQASRLDDSSFALPAFVGTETDAYLQADVYVSFWGNGLGLGTDVDLDGAIRETQPGELGPRVYLASNSGGGVSFRSASGVLTQVPIASADGAAGDEWIRVRVVMDFGTNNGAGKASVLAMNLTQGSTTFHAVAGLQVLDLGLVPGAGDARNPLSWNGQWLRFEGATGQIDNLKVDRTTHVKSYTMNALNGTNTHPFVPLHGQDGWTAFSQNTAVPLGVTATTGSDGTPAVRFQEVGPGVGAQASRLNDAGFSLPSLSGLQTNAFLQADIYVPFWAAGLGLGTDVDLDGTLRETQPGELGPRVLLASNSGGGVSFRNASGVLTQVPIATADGAAQDHWIRVRVVMDLSANNGAGKASLSAMNLSTGSTGFQPVAGMQGLNLGLVPGAGDARDPVTWHGLWLRFEGATGQLDNLECASSLTPESPAVYCQAQVNSQGCTPAIGYSGAPSVSAGSGFLVTAAKLMPSNPGILFYSKTGPASMPLMGGLLCVKPPTVRTAPQGSGGSGACTGAMSFDFNAYVASGFDAGLVLGQGVWAQYWTRDPSSPSAANLTDALAFVLCQ